MNSPITLPATAEAFVVCQEELIHRHLSANELEATVEWYEVFSDIRAGDLDGTVALERVGFLISHTDDPCLLRFLNAARAWIRVVLPALPPERSTTEER